MHKLEELCDGASKDNKRIARSCESINEGIKEWSNNLMDVEKNIEKAYTDSCYLLLEVSKKK